jgi:hypothetical protein
MLQSVEPPEINEKPIDHKSKVKFNIAKPKLVYRDRTYEWGYGGSGEMKKGFIYNR